MSPRSPSRHEASGAALIVFGDPMYARAYLIPPVAERLAVTYVLDLADARAQLPDLRDLRLALIDLELEQLGPDRVRAAEVGVPPSLGFAVEIHAHAPGAHVAALTRRGPAIHINAAHLLGVTYLHRQHCSGNLQELVHRAAEGGEAEDHVHRHQFLRRAARGRLTARQLDVAHGLLCGMTREDVAAYLGISGATVKSHIRKLLRSCGIDSTAELLRAYLRWSSRADERAAALLPERSTLGVER